MISGAFALFLLAGGSANAAYSSDNRDLNDDIERECENPGSRTFEDICDNLPRVRDSEAAAAVSNTYCIYNKPRFTIVNQEAKKKQQSLSE